ncbi:SpoIIE family protein phosphatase [Actinomadura sp. DC4]|uniref:PP2C family protein-serine/threonine phosphatase n=1 Tax=Actinomadura sp. DC4 TaxID=3055069 RepID=UPI0025B1DBF0|nr:SpoIIE family protein phosphatase [Actinomadura sp. DC4]MDN3354840.1 SpoIIE family protein phosphatase [Actinomadura sp. DC4]
MRTADLFDPSRVPVAGRDALDILLIEDDLGDALLVQEFLDEGELDAQLVVARSFAEARGFLGPGGPGFHCVLVDLSLPDANGLDMLREVLRLAPHTAVLVLTGLNDAQVGVAAVGAGAQDYLVKQEVEPPLLTRAVRYAIERKRADESERELGEARLLSSENNRLARGLLPVPQLDDVLLRHHTRYSPGRRRALLGGDFYDTIQTPDGAVHLMIGDVSGHGPDEASLGVRLRMAWRTLVLAGQRGEALLVTLDRVLTLERWTEEIFTTLCMVTVHPDRRHATMYRAGHPRPLLFSGSGVRAMPEEACGPAIGLFTDGEWPAAEIELPDSWGLMLYTDGLIEGRVGHGSRRLDTEGLVDLAAQALRRGMTGQDLIDALVADAEDLNGGVLTDDLAILLLAG